MDKPTATHEADISIGSAVIKAHCDGGWALPGGEVTRDYELAKHHCLVLHKAITDTGGRPRAIRTGAWPRRSA